LSSASAREDELKEGIVLVRIVKPLSGSMLPTLPIGDAVLTNVQFPTKQLRIGEVVTFKLPKDKSTMYVKRIVGMGGDQIQMRDGILHINGQAVKRERVEDYMEEGVSGTPIPIKRWRETLPNGVSYMTLDLVDNGFYDNTPLYKVPQNHYFMIGDNRDNSTDSRVLSQVGYVPIENIAGKVCCLVYPLNMDKTGIPGLP
jgi:signal peptidase I